MPLCRSNGGPAWIWAPAVRATRRLTGFRAGVDLVALDVYVKDRDGRLIPGLAQEDFLVLEDGSPQGASGSTGLYEAVLLALSDLRRLREHAAREYRYVVIILSNGEDTTGRLAFDEVVRAVRRSDVIVYGVSV